MLQVNRLRQHDSHQISTHSLVAQAASAITIVVGCLVLQGLWLDLEFLKNCFSLSMVTMKANAALCFILSGISLWLLLQCNGENIESNLPHQPIAPPPPLTILSRVCAIAVVIIGLLTLSEYLFGWNLGIDVLLRESPNAVITSHPGRMGLNTALNFTIVGRAIQLMGQPKTHRSYWYAQVLALIAALISLEAIIGYAYGVDILNSVRVQSASMALHTAILFIVLCVGILWTRPSHGLMRLVTSDTYGGLLARRLLLAAIAVPLVLGWLILQGQRAGVYEAGFAVSLLVLVLIVSFCVLIWESAAALERLTSQRDHVKEALRAFVDANLIGILFSDVHGNIRKANDEFLRMIGYTQEDILADKISWIDITAPEYLSLDKQRIAEAQENGACTPYEKEYIRKDGSRVSVLMGYTLVGDKREESVAFILDLSDRKQVELALRNQQKWLEDVLNLMPIPMLLIEPGTARVTFANRAADELAGGEFPKGKPAQEYHTIYHCTDTTGNLIPNEQMPGVRVARGEALDGVEIDWHTPGGIRSLLIFADTLPAMHGHPATCILVFQDITNLKRVEKALSLGYKRLQLLFNTANDLLSSQQPAALIDSLFTKLSEQIPLDAYFNYLVYENRQVLQLASYSGIDEELGKEIEWLEFGEGICGSVAQERLPIALENVQQLTDWKTECLRSVGITAFYSYPLIAQGRLLGTLAFASRSRVKFTQNEMGMMQAVCDQIAIAMERERLIASLQQQTEELRETNRMKDEFLAILSHELRSPLNAILGWAQLLRSRRQLDESKKAKALETIERNARAQTQLIEDLLDISRMIRGKLRLNICTCDLVPIVEAAIETVRLAAQAKKIDLKFSILDFGVVDTGDWGIRIRDGEENSPVPLPKSPIPNPKYLVCGDAERLQQVIWNLLSNAIKFTAIGGLVEIRLSTTTGNGSWDIPTLSPSEANRNDDQLPITSYAQIQVSDTGIGISSDFLPYVFDRFRQADSSSTRSHGGLGLGLALVRHLVELHGGTVHVESPGSGQGATFTVKLPTP